MPNWEVWEKSGQLVVGKYGEQATRPEVLTILNAHDALVAAVRKDHQDCSDHLCHGIAALRLVTEGGRVPVAPVKSVRREVGEEDTPEVRWDPPTFGRELGVVLLGPRGADVS